MWTVHSFFQLMHITDDHAANNDQIEATNGGQKGRQKNYYNAHNFANKVLFLRAMVLMRVESST